jgi:ABC-type transport system involved in cytochrome c biogenesis permease component
MRWVMLAMAFAVLLLSLDVKGEGARVLAITFLAGSHLMAALLAVLAALLYAGAL